MADGDTQQAAPVDAASDQQTSLGQETELSHSSPPGSLSAISPTVLSLLDEARELRNRGCENSANRVNRLAGDLAYACACGNQLVGSIPMILKLMTENQALMMQKLDHTEQRNLLCQELLQVQSEVTKITSDIGLTNKHIDHIKEFLIDRELQLGQTKDSCWSLKCQNHHLREVTESAEKLIRQTEEGTSLAKQPISQVVNTPRPSRGLCDNSSPEKE